MKPSYSTSFFVGAVAGAILALSLFTYFAAAGAVRTLQAEVVGSDLVPTFAPSASATWYMVILGGLIGGTIIAIVTYALSRVVDPDGSAGSLWVMVPVGSVVAAIVSMIVFPLGVTVLGSITDGNAVIGVADMVVLVVVAGAVAGGIVAWLSAIIARPTTPAPDDELLVV
ncbi:MAG: hypothetical protein KDB69_03635 [Acidimicrobiia bacterium]|nr:hypothetical protein [Acidimicrobiia bacterium]